MEDSDRRKRINRYKKMILRILFIFIIINVVLWIYIMFKMNNIEDKINDMNLVVLYGRLWRICR